MEPIHVLIVEDDPMVADINQNFTDAVEGFRVVGIARNGAEALEKLGNSHVDLIILDVYMPQVNGIEFLTTLRSRGKMLDVIMITAANDMATISKIIGYGIWGYIIKPFKFERYRTTLEAYRGFREKTKLGKTVTQQELDLMLSQANRPTEKTLPKNLHTQTLNSIIQFLESASLPQSAEEVANGVGIARVTARRYLEYLANEGRVRTVLEYISVGRPIHRFQIQ